MDILRISHRFRENYERRGRVSSNPEEALRIIEAYCAIPLTLKITDASIRRLCEVLTLEGFETLESCEGHGKNKPKVHFYCQDNNRIRYLADIIYRESEEKNFEWVINRDYFDDEGFNPPTSYVLRPKIKSGKKLDKITYGFLIDDLDIIGLCVLRYFGYANLDLALADAK